MQTMANEESQSESECSNVEFVVIGVDSPIMKRRKCQNRNGDAEHLVSVLVSKEEKYEPKIRNPYRYNSKFSTFFKVIYPSIKQESQEFSLSKVNKKVATLWNSMSTKERDQFFMENAECIEKIKSEQQKPKGIKLFQETIRANGDDSCRNAKDQWKAMTINERIGFGMRQSQSRVKAKKRKSKPFMVSSTSTMKR